MFLVAHTEGGLSLFHFLGVVSGMFQTLLACYGMFGPFHFLQATKSQNVLACKFTTNLLHIDFLTKECKHCYDVGQFQVVQVL